MFRRMSVWHKLLLLVLIPLVFEILFASSLALLLGYAEEQTDQYEKSKEVVMRINMAVSGIAHTMLAIFLGFISHQERLGLELDRATETISESRNMIASTAHIRPELAYAIAPIPKALDRGLDILTELKKLQADQNVPLSKELSFVYQNLFPLLNELRQITDNLIRAENDMRAVGPRELEVFRIAVFVILGFGLLFSTIISISASIVFSKNIVKRLEQIEQNAQLLAIRAPFTAEAIGSDEIDKLAISLEEASHVLTETRQRELTILDVATDVICSIDKRFRFTAVGAAALPSWGYEPDNLLGESLISLQVKEDEPSFRAALASITGSDASGEFNSQLICKNGNLKDILWKVKWVGATQSFYCVAHDISERRAAERMKQRFIAIASHDLRTPLSSISVTLSILIAGGVGEVPAKAQQILQKADENLERLMDLIRDLLDLEKLEAGKIVMSMSVVSAMDVCLTACDSLEFLADSLGVSIAKPFNDATLRADERSLVRVVTNLLANAIKFSPRGSTVSVMIKNLPGMTEISVTDQGPGIPVQDREIIFEKFRQSKSKANTAIKGTGLGLAISKLITEAHGGTIGVDSVEGQGSCFYIRIPSFEDGEGEE